MSRNIAHHDGVIRIVSANYISEFAFLSNIHIEILTCSHKFIRVKSGKTIEVASNPKNLQMVFKIWNSIYILVFFTKHLSRKRYFFPDLAGLEKFRCTHRSIRVRWPSTGSVMQKIFLSIN